MPRWNAMVVNEAAMQTLTRGSFAKAATSLGFNTGEWRTSRPVHHHRTAPCAVGCPAGENPQAYIALMAQDNPRGAWEMLVRANPMPAITGRVCPHPCESRCNRGAYDESIAIHSVERFLGDQSIEKGWNFPVARPPAGAPPVAIIGAGPAGLSAAYHALRLGLSPTLFEADPNAGGLLRSALPLYRLPRDVLDAELERLLAMAIVFRPNTRIGRDASLEELAGDFRAIFVAPGTGSSRSWSVDGVEPAGTKSGIELLKEWTSIGELPVSRRVAIVGGGNTAIDLARLMKFRGAGEVHVITFQSLPGPGVAPADAMSAAEREIRQALEEGVTIHDRRGVRRLILRGAAVVGVEMVHMKELDRGGGLREQVAFEGTETVLKVDQVVPAVGQVVEHRGFEHLLGGASFFAPDEFGRLAGHPGIFVGGDARASGGTVAGAIGDGRRAAEAIRSYVDGTGEPRVVREVPIGIEQLNLNYFEHAPRTHAAIVAPAERSAELEIEAAVPRGGIDHEARRCFSCGECMACDNCWTLCPDNSVLKARSSADGTWRYIFDYDHCKGCGICARECPVGFIEMVDET